MAKKSSNKSAQPSTTESEVATTAVEVATTEVATTEVVDVKAVEVVDVKAVEESTQPSILSSLLNQEVKPLEEVKVEEVKTIKVEKNQGVGMFIRKLIAKGMSNKDILKEVHDAYGNQNTTYACVAWYRNKMKKTQQVEKTTSAAETVQKFLDKPAEVESVGGQS